MKRVLGLERTFYLGQYRNIKVYDSIIDIPEELLLNPQFVASIRALQLANVDNVYLDYIKKSPTMNPDFNAGDPKTIEEAVEVIEKTRITSFENLKEAMASQTEPKNTQQKESIDE